MIKKLLSALTICTTIVFSQNTNVQFKSQLTFPGQTCANIGGFADSLNNEYALVCASKGLAIVDVTVPTNPILKKQVSGPTNLWREVKTYKGFAYVTNEADSGLQIINLNGLPDTTLPSKFWKGDGAIAGLLKTIHALHIDTTKGFAYLYGSNSNLANGGVIVADLTNPWNPTYAGKYNSHYVHDGYVDNDTLYAGEIYQGKFTVINFANKVSPQVLQSVSTPGNFTHNTWISDNRKVIYTTDEVNGSYLAAYDISNLTNITELDRIQSNPGSGSVVHNVHIHNDYAVSSWYKDGFTIVDAHRPTNLVQVGNYDTYSGSGSGFEGAWGVYPYLPSGNILVTNINEGLFVLTPTYVRASYLEGTVVDSSNGAPIFNAKVDILSTSASDNSLLNGTYATGTPQSGSFSVLVSKVGYYSKTIPNVNLSNGIVSVLHVTLTPIPTTNFSVTVYDNTGNPLSSASASLINTIYTYTANSNASGTATFSGVKIGTYTLVVGKWGYIAECNGAIISLTPTPLSFSLSPGYSDDFSVDLGWTISGTATSGTWVRAKPVGTIFNTTTANPATDASSNDCLDFAYITGNGGGAPSFDDVDNGVTILTSPSFDLTSYSNPEISFYKWFFNDGGAGSPNDSLELVVSNGITADTVAYFDYTSPNNSTWDLFSFPVKNHIALTSTMNFKISIWDKSPFHLVEGGIDNFEIKENTSNSITTNTSPTNELKQVFGASSSYLAYQTIVSHNNQYRIEIIDLTGKKIKQYYLNDSKGMVELNSSDLSKGLYIGKLVVNNETRSVTKIIIH
ncbi:MAG: choice-of-anchor B family protein [Bacteroidetes bacterium]|nr:choice-of-anchor B family protein [Bacteroidota bacterium]